MDEGLAQGCELPSVDTTLTFMIRVSVGPHAGSLQLVRVVCNDVLARAMQEATGLMQGCMPQSERGGACGSEAFRASFPEAMHRTKGASNAGGNLQSSSS